MQPAGGVSRKVFEACDLALVEPSLELADAYLDMVRDLARAGETGRGRLRVTPESFADFLAGLRRESEGVGLSEGQVPQTTYWLLRSDGVIVGTSRLRHYLTPELSVWGGHVGYEVRPTERRKGYGTRLLALTLEKARARGLDRVLLTCDDDNVGSYRVIEGNGGRLAGRVTPPDTGTIARRYWIALVAREASWAPADLGAS